MRLLLHLFDVKYENPDFFHSEVLYNGYRSLLIYLTTGKCPISQNAPLMSAPQSRWPGPDLTDRILN